MNGDPRAAAEVYDSIYGELRKIARAELKGWGGNHTVDTTALIHEAYIKLMGASGEGPGDYASRVHFFATAAKAMRQVMVSFARKRSADKRAHELLTVDIALVAATAASSDVLDLDEALTSLEKLSERQCRVVECRFFAGMNIEETGIALDISPATVKREWLLASVELHRLLSAED